MSSDSLYHLSVWIHIVAAAVWTGGLIYTGAVVIPFALTHEPQERQRILRGLARRFRRIGWTAIVLLFITGIGNLTFRISPVRLSQIVSGEVFDPAKVEHLIAIWLPWKLMLVVVMIALMLYHDISSIYAAKRFEGSPDIAPGSRAGSTAAAIATLLAILIFYVSVRLVRG
jgi:uncharacterized membrane protein